LDTIIIMVLVNVHDVHQVTSQPTLIQVIVFNVQWFIHAYIQLNVLNHVQLEHINQKSCQHRVQLVLLDTSVDQNQHSPSPSVCTNMS